MACIMDPKVGPNGEHLKWEPTEIPSTKPFVNIVTTASEPMLTFDSMNFVKMKSLIYSPFHKEARYVNFEIGYARDATWLEYLNNRWTEYANFFVGGFLEAIYSSGEKGTTTTYAQINAKMVDYDTRLKTSNSNVQSPVVSPNSSTNVFARKRTSNSLPSSPKSSKSAILRTDSINSDTMQDVQEVSDDDIEDADDLSESIVTRTHIDIDESTANDGLAKFSSSQTSSASTTQTRKPKRQLSDLCNVTEEPINKPKRTYNRKGRGRKVGRGAINN